MYGCKYNVVFISCQLFCTLVLRYCPLLVYTNLPPLAPVEWTPYPIMTRPTSVPPAQHQPICQSTLEKGRTVRPAPQSEHWLVRRSRVRQALISTSSPILTKPISILSYSPTSTSIPSTASTWRLTPSNSSSTLTSMPSSTTPRPTSTSSSTPTSKPSYDKCIKPRVKY